MLSSPAMRRVTRYAVAGGVMDFTIYVALSLSPLLATSWGAGPEVLGLLPVAWGVAYSLTAVLGGRFSDRVSRTALMRCGLLLIVVVCGLFTRATETWHFLAGYPFIALGMSLFWPALQAAIADESGPETLTKNLGIFNVCWGTGKGLGVLAGGVLVELVGQDGYYVAAGVAAALFVFLPRVPRGGGEGRPLVGAEESEPPRVRKAFRVSALLANFAAFGLGTTIVNHYPDWNAELGRSGFAYGIVVGGVFLAQTAGFAVLRRWTRWRYRAVPHVAVQVLAAGGAVVLATGLPVPALLAFVPVIGAGFALAYFSSIYYSLHADDSRGGRAGLHEAILGTGNFLVPMAAGGLAGLAGSARVPYLFGAAVVIAAVIAQVPLLARARTMGRVPGRG